jgi:dsDNA-specific endonuclease/ATPase MutS2
MKELNFSSNDSMLRHVAQNNEIIARILRELDDKSESLRQAAAEISDLRGRVKLLQNENSILRQQALREEDELVSLVQREVENMGVRELKEKIVKMSQLYKL